MVREEISLVEADAIRDAPGNLDHRSRPLEARDV
jgi:hypothetical protein